MAALGRSQRDLTASSKENVLRDARRSETAAAGGLGYSHAASRSSRLAHNSSENIVPNLNSSTSSGLGSRPCGSVGLSASVAGLKPGPRGGASTALMSAAGRFSPRSRAAGPLGDITNIVNGATASAPAGKVGKPLRGGLANRHPQPPSHPQPQAPPALSPVQRLPPPQRQPQSAAAVPTPRHSPPRRLPAPRQIPMPQDMFALAMDAVCAASKSRGLSSDWTSSLAKALEEPSRCPQIRAVLEGHGWFGAYFVGPPDRKALLSDLIRSSNAKAAPPQDAARSPRAIEDVAAFNAPFRNDANDIQQVAEYAEEVHTQLFQKERTLALRADYMSSQRDINAVMRGILLDWLVQVHFSHFKFKPETLFLAQHLTDRYLSSRVVMREQLQLVGVTCMLIAAKFEEVDVPKVTQFAHVTDNTFTTDDIVKMECRILIAVNFQVVVPTAVHFTHRLERANGSDPVQKCLTQYLMELALLEIQSIRYAPSHLACASILLSNELTGRRATWPAAMVYHGRYTESALRGCADELRRLLEAASRSGLQAVQEKFRLHVHHGVADRFARPRN